MRWILLLLFLAVPIYSQDDDDDDDESSIEVESDEPDTEDEPENAEAKPTKKTTRPAGKGEWIRITRKDSPLSVSLIDTWPVSDFQAQKTGWSCAVRHPGAARITAMLDVGLYDLPNDPRGLPSNIRRGVRDNESITEFRIGSKVLPHIIYDRDRGEHIEVVIQAFKQHRGRTIHIALSIDPTAFDTVYETFLKAAATAEVDLPPFPSAPENYKTSTKRGITYAVHPSVKGSLKHFQSVTQAAQKSFEKFHGKLPKIPRDAHAPITFIHSNQEQAGRIAPGLEKEIRPFVNEVTTLRFFATPVRADDNQGSHNLATAFGQFMLGRKYGSAVPRWALVGELNVAGVEYEIGKRLPWIPAGVAQWANGIQLPRLDTYNPGNEDSVPRVCFYYVAFFHAGGSKYKKAYRAYLTDLATHYDPAAAAKRHLEPLGYDRIQSAATKFMHSGCKIMKQK